MQNVKMLKSSGLNNDNDAFFDRFTPDVHDECLFNAGLATNKYLTFIQGLVQQAETILEIGAGYGRIVNGIKAISQQTHIDAIEKNPLIFKQLRTLSHVAGVTLYNQDIFDFLSHSNKQYDLVLLLWSTLAVFSPAEQFTLLERLKCHLNRGGKIVIDFFLSAKGNLKPHIMNNHYHVIADQTSHFGYLCPRNRLKKIVEALGYANINFYEYVADEGVGRELVILESSSYRKDSDYSCGNLISNKTNKAIYDNMTCKDFFAFVQSCGLKNGCDFDQINQLIDEAIANPLKLLPRIGYDGHFRNT